MRRKPQRISFPYSRVSGSFIHEIRIGIISVQAQTRTLFHALWKVNILIIIFFMEKEGRIPCGGVLFLLELCPAIHLGGFDQSASMRIFTTSFTLGPS